MNIFTMEDSTDWKMLKMCSDKLDLIITSSVTYSKNDHFCSIVIDGLLIAATKGVALLDTINATAKKAIIKIEKYSHPQMGYGSLTETNLDLHIKFRHFFPLFERYIVNFKSHVAATSQSFETHDHNPNNANAVVSTMDWSWNTETYNPNCYLTKNYTTANNVTGVTVKVEPREVRVVKRKMLHERNNHIDQSNIGFKMLLGLGWSGGPLGPNQDGISEPISVELRARRSGLGCADRQSKSAYGNITSPILFQFLKEYADDDRQYEDLEFSDDFSNKEKKKLFGIAKDLNLHIDTSEHRNGMLVVKIMKPNYNYQ